MIKYGVLNKQIKSQINKYYEYMVHLCGHLVKYSKHLTYSVFMLDRNKHNAQLFDRESDDLISDLKLLPLHTATRKVNEFVKRVRQFLVHLLICSYLKNSCQ